MDLVTAIWACLVTGLVGLGLGVFIAVRLMGDHYHDNIISDSGFDHNGYRWRVTRGAKLKE